MKDFKHIIESYELMEGPEHHSLNEVLLQDATGRVFLGQEVEDWGTLEFVEAALDKTYRSILGSVLSNLAWDEMIDTADYPLPWLRSAR